MTAGNADSILAQERVAAFHRDPPLCRSFPVRLRNGTQLRGFRVHCVGCGRELPEEAVHGRLVEVSPTVRRVEATAYCGGCESLISLEGRYRETGSGHDFEYVGGDGRWHVLRWQPPWAQRLRTALARWRRKEGPR
jgi:hypothetical protein